jgi:hypothetical protein
VSEDINPDAPWGYHPKTGKPYRRDPAAFAHLRGRPFGASAPADKKSATTVNKPVRRAAKVKDTTPPKGTPMDYARKISKGADVAGAGLMTRGESGMAAGLVLRVSADQLGMVWGPVAVSKPKIGRGIDKLTAQSEMSLAVGTTMGTFAMMARAAKIIPDKHPIAKFIDKMIVDAVEKYEANHPEEFADMMASGVNDATDEAVPVPA